MKNHKPFILHTIFEIVENLIDKGFSRVPVKRKSEDDIMSISSDSREATPSSKSEKVQDPKERTTGPSVSKPKRVRKQTDPVEMPKIRKSQRQTRSSCSKSSPEMDETS